MTGEKARMKEMKAGLLTTKRNPTKIVTTIGTKILAVHAPKGKEHGGSSETGVLPLSNH